LVWQVAEQQQPQQKPQQPAQPLMPLLPSSSSLPVTSTPDTSFQDMFASLLQGGAQQQMHPAPAPTLPQLQPPSLGGAANLNVNQILQAQQILQSLSAQQEPDLSGNKRAREASPEPETDGKRFKLPDDVTSKNDSLDTLSASGSGASGDDSSHLKMMEVQDDKVRYMEYECGYCSQYKVSTSSGADGRVRIRCECGGKHRDRKPRMHAKWVARPGCGGSQEHLKSRMRAQWRQSTNPSAPLLPSQADAMILQAYGIPPHLQQIFLSSILQGQQQQQPVQQQPVAPAPAMPFHNITWQNATRA